MFFKWSRITLFWGNFESPKICLKKDLNFSHVCPLLHAKSKMEQPFYEKRLWQRIEWKMEENTSLGVKKALAHRMQQNQNLKNPKWPPGGPKMANGVWIGVYPYLLGHTRQLSLNNFFYLSAPSMRKVDDGKRKNNVVFSGHQRRCQSAARTPTDWNTARPSQKKAKMWQPQ